MESIASALFDVQPSQIADNDAVYRTPPHSNNTSSSAGGVDTAVEGYTGDEEAFIMENSTDMKEYRSDEVHPALGDIEDEDMADTPAVATPLLAHSVAPNSMQPGDEQPGAAEEAPTTTASEGESHTLTTSLAAEETSTEAAGSVGNNDATNAAGDTGTEAAAAGEAIAAAGEAAAAAGEAAAADESSADTFKEIIETFCGVTGCTDEDSARNFLEVWIR